MCFERVAASDQNASVMSDQPSTAFKERDPNVAVDHDSSEPTWPRLTKKCAGPRQPHSDFPNDDSASPDASSEPSAPKPRKVRTVDDPVSGTRIVNEWLRTFTSGAPNS